MGLLASPVVLAAQLASIRLLRPCGRHVGAKAYQHKYQCEKFSHRDCLSSLWLLIDLDAIEACDAVCLCPKPDLARGRKS
jgi:hypothetical protein